MRKRQSKYFQFKLFKKVTYTLILIFFVAYVVFIFFTAFKDGIQDINYAGIDATTNNNSIVYIDDVKIGSAKSNDSFVFSKVEPGSHRLKIVSSEDDSLKYEKDVIFEKGTTVTVDWTFGVTNETSSGLIKYFVKKSDDVSKIHIVSTVPKSSILIDGQQSKDGQISADGSDHSVEISKDGYLSKVITISLFGDTKFSNDTEKKRYSDYDLVVEVSLFQIPFE